MLAVGAGDGLGDGDIAALGELRCPGDFGGDVLRGALGADVDAEGVVVLGGFDSKGGVVSVVGKFDFRGLETKILSELFGEGPENGYLALVGSFGVGHGFG